MFTTLLLGLIKKLQTLYFKIIVFLKILDKPFEGKYIIFILNQILSKY